MGETVDPHGLKNWSNFLNERNQISQVKVEKCKKTYVHTVENKFNGTNTVQKIKFSI